MNNDGLEPLNDDDCEEGISPITNGGLQEQFDGGEIDIKRWTRLLRMIKVFFIIIINYHSKNHDKN